MVRFSTRTVTDISHLRDNNRPDVRRLSLPSSARVHLVSLGPGSFSGLKLTHVYRETSNKIARQPELGRARVPTPPCDAMSGPVLVAPRFVELLRPIISSSGSELVAAVCRYQGNPMSSELPWRRAGLLKSSR
jgi:hypothetical protein